jgi:hypothetical protein
MALLIESASAEASLRSLLVEFPLASDLGKATVMIVPYVTVEAAESR